MPVMRHPASAPGWPVAAAAARLPWPLRVPQRHDASASPTFASLLPVQLRA